MPLYSTAKVDSFVTDTTAEWTFTGARSWDSGGQRMSFTSNTTTAYRSDWGPFNDTARVVGEFDFITGDFNRVAVGFQKTGTDHKLGIEMVDLSGGNYEVNLIYGDSFAHSTIVVSVAIALGTNFRITVTRAGDNVDWEVRDLDFGTVIASATTAIPGGALAELGAGQSLGDVFYEAWGPGTGALYVNKIEVDVVVGLGPGLASSQPRIRVRTVGVGPGTSADLTDSVVGLSWSSVNPGGDERATFQLKRQWFAGAPEIQQGNILFIEDGLDRLWSGRIEENDRAVSDSEYVGVTAYGFGVRLKDTTMVEVYGDRDPDAWTTMPYNRRVAVGNTVTVDADYRFHSEAGGLLFEGSDAKAITDASRTEAWYTAPQGVTITALEYIGAEANTTNVAAALFVLASDDAASATTNAALTLDSTLRTATPATPTRFAYIPAQASSTHTPAAGTALQRRLKVFAVYGNHGLTKRAIDSTTPDGFYVSDIVRDVIGRSTGVTAARIDATTNVLPHFTVKDPTTLEDVIAQANQYENCDWGTFGAESVFDASTTGYFCFKARDTATAHWSGRRSDCDDVSLQVELASLYNAVDVVYTDPTTSGQQIATRTATVQALSDAGLTRKAVLQGGTLTQAGAQTLGDKFLDLTSQQAPARGSILLSGRITHYQRGPLPAHFMRADGSNIRVADVLPSKDALSLSSAPDRRTTFPVKRVSVDCSGMTPRTTVEVDQADERLSSLQARLGLAAQFPGAWPIDK